VTTHRAALSDFVVAGDGPIPVSDLVAGENVVSIDAQGRLTYARLTGASPGESYSSYRLLTSLGDVIVSDGMCITTRHGPMSGSGVASHLRDGVPLFIEVVRRQSFPSWEERSVPRDAAILAACMTLPRTIVFPAPLCREAQVDRRLADLMQDAGLAVVARDDGRWRSLHVTGGSTLGTQRGGFRHQLEVLSLGAAWCVDANGALELRVRDRERRARQAILMAALGARKEVSVSWIPGYAPVEARIRLPEKSASSFASVTGCRAEMHVSRDLDLVGARQIVVGGAMLMPQHQIGL
jgi:hypothetical protein